MISGQVVTENSDNVLIRLKNLEQLTTNFAPPPTGVELEIFPWLKYFGHHLVNETKVLTEKFYCYCLSRRYFDIRISLK